MRIEHYVGGESIGVITPDTPRWRKHTLDNELKSAVHYNRKPKKVYFKER